MAPVYFTTDASTTAIDCIMAPTHCRQAPRRNWNLSQVTEHLDAFAF